MQTKKFKKNREDFTCTQCGKKVKGDGFTNHCPECFYSKHVDINPGDRQENCKTLMEPVRVEVDHGEQIIVHQCMKCGLVKRNKLSKSDNLEKLREIIQNLAKK